MNAHVGTPSRLGLLGRQQHHAPATRPEEEPAAGRPKKQVTLPTMALHGCAPDHHRTRLQDGVVVREECVQCGYRISYEPVDRNRSPRPGWPPDREPSGPGRGRQAR